GKLPWSKAEPASPPAPARQPTSARELLVNLDESQLQAFVDGRPLVVDEEESLIRVLFRVPKFGPSAVESLARKPDDWKPLVNEPDKYRIEIYALRGRVQKVERTDLLPEQADRFDFNHYYRVTMQLADSPCFATVCTQIVPEAWKKAAELDE